MTPKARRLTILDLMIVTAAMATAFTVVGFQSWYFDKAIRSDYPGYWIFIEYNKHFPMMRRALPGLAAFSLAALVMRLVPPRPPARRLTRQPGLTASLAVASFLVITILVTEFGLVKYLVWTAFTVPTGRDRPLRWEPTLFRVLSSLEVAGLGVSIVWTVQVLCRRWRAEKGWLDRLGRVLGILWIASYWVPRFLEYP